MQSRHAARTLPPHPARLAGSTLRAGDPLLNAAGPLHGSNVLVIGPGALDTMCALIGRDCASVTELRCDSALTPEPGSADVVVVPCIATAPDASAAIALAARALAKGGHIALRDVSCSLQQTVTGLLRIHGFTTMRSRMTRAGTLISAEKPIFGPLPQA